MIGGAGSDEREAVRQIKQEFLGLTGLRDVDAVVEQPGQERYLAFVVGRKAPFYENVLARINQKRSPADPFYGALVLTVVRQADVLRSQEVALLRALVQRSLRVTSASVDAPPLVEFAPFRSGEELTVIQPANHAILGRRGVGKSTLILTAYRRIASEGHVPVWLDLEPYRGAKTLGELAPAVTMAFRLAADFAAHRGMDSLSLVSAYELVQVVAAEGEEALRRAVPELNALVSEFTKRNPAQLYMFLDDAHYVQAELQPLLLELLHGALKGAGGWLNVAGLKNFLKLYDREKMRGLQAGQDVLEVDLDLTLAEPAEAYDHLFGILQRFLTACGFTKHTTIIPERAIKRLVWSSAGVARDFLSLFERAIGHAQAHRRGRVGVEDVNLSVGDLAAPKMRELEEDTSQEGPLIRDALEQLQRVCLNKHKSNSFLIRQEPRALGYQLLQKLVDLRLVHLLHPSVTPRRAGERYEAYLLDYSFYTGVRKRRLLEELTIIPGEPWSHAQRRRLPRIEPDELVTPAERSGDD